MIWLAARSETIGPSEMKNASVEPITVKTAIMGFISIARRVGTWAARVTLNGWGSGSFGKTKGIIKDNAVSNAPTTIVLVDIFFDIKTYPFNTEF